MKRESFEDGEIARFLNENFVCIKVDREELPDVDNLYMTAVQMMTGRGGWPMSVVMLPDGRPFFAGTYFPPEDRHGQPGFKTLMREISTAYRTRRAEVEAVAARAAEALRHQEDASASAGSIGEAPLDALMEQLRRRFDEANGGFGTRPKFPPHTSFPALFYAARERKDPEALRMASRTLETMALGGIHDHLGGGLARYSTDERWFLPHFEKMLYDNGMLLRWFAEGYSLTQNPRFREAAEGIAGWLEREMTHPEGGFYSALDAESEHEEGKFYVWSYEEILKILGQKEGALFCEIYGARPDGNFHDEASGQPTGRNILFLKRALDEEAKARKDAGLEKHLAASRAKLLAERNKRVPPGLDDKVLVSWNALAIDGLAHAGKVFGETSWTARAEKAARFVLARMRSSDGRLLRRFREGEAKIPAYLEDYAYFTDALLTLHEVTGREEWLKEARALAEVMISDFWDAKDGGFFTTSSRHDKLLLRTKDSFDSMTPSANGVAARALLRLHRATGEDRWLRYGRGTLDAFAEGIERMPQALTTLAMAAALLPAAETGAGPRPAAEAKKHPVEAALFLPEKPLKAGERIEARLRLRVAGGWHVNSASPRDKTLTPTSLSAGKESAFAVDGATWPKGRDVKLGFSDAPLSIYEGEMEIPVSLRALESAGGGRRPLRLLLRFQACDHERCLAPAELELKAEVEIQ
jgi:hypothetical protein